jgi:hypothetical protein
MDKIPDSCSDDQSERKLEIQNRIANIESYLKTSPIIKGLSEIHIFFSPINPKPKTVEKFVEICNGLNKERAEEKNFNKIKPCHLSLHFKDVGDLRVMQSSRYITSNDMHHVIRECYGEADKMQKLFDEAYKKKEIDERVNVIREKIEAIASANGVPKTGDESKKYARYFEHHIKLRRKDQTNIEPITEDEIVKLKELSKKFSEKFKRPVPLSFVNNMFHQRYLNVRFEEIGYNEAMKNVKDIEIAINETEEFVWEKTISEYVWFDSYRQLDKGWIDF